MDTGGGGIFSKEESHRPVREVIPHHVKWIKDAAREFLPAQDAVVPRQGEVITCDWNLMLKGLA